MHITPKLESVNIDRVPHSVSTSAHVPSIKDWEQNLTLLAKSTQSELETATSLLGPCIEVMLAGLVGVAGVLGESITLRSSLMGGLD